MQCLLGGLVMRAFKWRLLLSVANVLLALGMSALGLHEYETDHRTHPEYFYHGNVYYVPPAQIVSYCLNVPALVASNLFRNFGIKHVSAESRLFVAQSFFHVYTGYYLAVLFFWWYVGWWLDVKLSPANIPRVLRELGWGLGALVSLALAYYGFAFRRGDWVPRVIPLSVMAWGVGLACYFVGRMLRVRSADRADGRKRG